ncbi:PAS domain S-box-containing protein [Azospirillum agricola]|uniref:PAS domain S-box protein n=1 Tax=Azospirillum agricola TaxID=1720247 RepID=UPI001AE9A6EB|nr:PAS domain S-box protein [Azospirillum agricola]MBP2232413.1 PAS domain S-box-containing protein [Azospirillum agricola]
MSLLIRLVVLVILAMVPAVAIQVHNERGLRREREAEIHQQAERLLALIQAEQARMIEGIRATLVAVRQIRFAREEDTSSCQGYMDRLQPDFPAHLDLLVVGRDGTIRCGTAPGAAGLTVADRSYVQTALRGSGFAVGEYIESRATGRGVLPFALALRDADGQPSGVVAATLDIGWFEERLRAMPLPADAEIVVADQGGHALVRLPARPGTTGRLLPPPYLALMTATPGTVEMADENGVTRIVAHSSFDYAPKELFVTVGLDKAAVAASLDAATWRSAGLLGLGFALLLATVVIGGRRLILKPVATLVATMRRWRAGDRSARAGLRGNSEIAALGHAFDAMADELERQVGQRERVESELRRNTELLDLVMEYMPAGVFVMAADGRIIRQNAAATRIWGGERKVGVDRYGEYKAWWADSGEPVAPDAWAVLRAVRDGETRLGEIIDIEGFDGSRKTIRNSAVPLRNGGGAIVGAVAVVEDITERLEAERRLERNLTLLDTILESSPDPIFVKDREGRYLVANSAAAFVFGMRRRDLVGAAERDLAEAGTAMTLLEHDRRIMESGQAETIDETVFSKGHGGLRHYLSTKTPLRGDDGRAIGIIGIARDITARKLAEMALRASEERYRGLVETQTEMIVRIGVDGRFTFVNDTACRTLGHSRAELLNARWTEFAHSEDIETIRSAIERTRTAPDHRATVEARIRTVKGFRWYAWEGYALFDEKGIFVEKQSVGRDVTERKAMEDALRRTKEEAERAKETAEQANLAKSKFLAAASHDLRQPMQSLFLFSAALAPHVTSERGQSTLSLLERGLDTLKALLDSLLDVSRLDAGGVQPQIADLPLDRIVEDIEVACTPVAAAKGVRLTVERSCGVVVRSDPTLLGRMIRNLVENAVRYTERGEIRVGCDVAGGRVRVVVSDTGIGIPPEHLEHIFEEFHQVGNVERDRSQGLGLGLAIVRRLSSLLDHPVHARSVLGRGSCFSIDVPLGRAGPPGPSAGPPPCAPAAVGQGMLALVVDDDAMVLSGLRTVLTGWNYEVAIAGSGDEALERLRALGRPPDIVIADYRLRDGEVGTAVIQRIRDAVGQPVPGIILTGETGPEHQREAARHDLGLAHKPVTPRQLHSALEQLLGAVR